MYSVLRTWYSLSILKTENPTHDRIPGAIRPYTATVRVVLKRRPTASAFARTVLVCRHYLLVYLLPCTTLSRVCIRTYSIRLRSDVFAESYRVRKSGTSFSRYHADLWIPCLAYVIFNIPVDMYSLSDHSG